MQKDKRFRVSGDWALASDNVQWVIQHRQGSRWEAVKFIHSTKEHLAFRLRQLAPHADAERLLDGLPDTFDQWLACGGLDGCHDVGTVAAAALQARPVESAMRPAGASLARSNGTIATLH
jgi:hypothetical protein